MARPTKKEIWKRNIAYGVTKKTPEVIQKFEQAFAIGATIGEGCDYADVEPSTYYKCVKETTELFEKIDRMPQKRPLKSKENIARTIHGEPVRGDISLSKWLIERQQPEGYGETLKIKDERNKNIAPEDLQVIEELHKKLEANRIKRSIDQAKREGEI